MQSKKLGFLFAILDMGTFGLLPVVSHYFVATMDPLVFSGAATLIGSIPLIFWLGTKNKLNQLYSKKYLPNLLLLAVLSTIGSILYFVGTKFTSGLNTGLLTQIEPFYAILLAVIVLKEVIGKNQIFATLLMVLGAGIVIYKGAMGFNIGDILVLLSPLVMQVSHLFAKKVYEKHADSNLVPTARLLFSGLLLLLIAMFVSPSSLAQLLSVKVIISVVFFGIVFRCLDFVLWYQAISRISVSKASAVIPLAVAISFVGSVFFLKESVSGYQLFGLFFILGGLIWLSKIHLAEEK